NAGIDRLEINCATVSLGLDLKALKEIVNQSSGDVSITTALATGLSKQAQAFIGNRPVYDITVSYVSDGKIVNVSNLGSGTATLSILYTPNKNESIDYLFGIYTDSEGDVTSIPGSAYDINSRSLIITTNHLSIYGVGYTEPSAKFTDIKTHWGKEYIDYVAGRRLLSGTSDTTFAPDTAMTRGMLVTVLGRMGGVDAKAYTTSSFTDVSTGKYYHPYVEWAYKNGIVQGIGNQQFAPDRAVFREEIAVIFANYAKAVGYKLPVIREATTYMDDSSIDDVYKTACTAIQQAGIMMGDNSNKFNPKSSTTRAEVSTILHRYIKLTINPATAQGWSINDAGQYFYYKNGKALSGWQNIGDVKYFFNIDNTLKTGWVKDGESWSYYSGNQMLTGWRNIGGKWYYFNTDGSLAKNTIIDGYEVDENGVRKTK
ncbi:MAG: S-layer homology domain-containing protein, partial [Tissierellia bacterium]|nr:S-layer homology domain-containing protein [Tissierellia bacterium]